MKPAGRGMKAKKIRILLADDHCILRAGLRLLLEREPDMVVVGEVGDGHAAIAQTRELRPDVVIMDISMPGLNGIDATLQIMADLFQSKILCLSIHRESGLVAAMLSAGASGYLLKSSVRTEVVDAVRTVAGGGTYLSSPIAGDIVERHVRGNGIEKTGAFMELSTREREVLQLVAEGHKTHVVAERLHIGPKTVLAHRQSLMRKLGLESTVDVTRYALREGISEL